jgi:flagellar hook-length control protein FliK
MKISDSQPPASDPDVNDVNSEDVDSSQKSTDDDQPSAFSQLLAKKKGPQRDDTPVKRFKGGEGDRDPMPPGFAQTGKAFDTPLRTVEIESKHVVALPADLQQLVREISVVVNAAGNQQVNIEMNSDVLKGLHIRIERGDAGVAIQFQSTSDQVSGLLIKNLDALSQGLAERGVSVADIRVESPRESARARDYKGQSNSGGRGQGGRQGGGR